MNQVGLIYVILLRCHVSPFADRLFADGYQRSLESSDPRQGLRLDSDPDPQQPFQLPAT